MYYKAIKTADLIGYTKPITYEILKECSSKHFYDLNEKIISIPLGYDSDIFYYSSHIRERKRSQLTYHKDDFVLVYVSKIEPRKQIKLLLDSVIKVMNVYSNLKLILVGFLNDRYDRIIKEYILKSGFRERFTCLPLLPRTELNEIYNAADLGVWHSLPTTTIIEALGTGLTVIVPDDLSFSTQYLPSSICQRFNAYDYNELTDILIASVKNVGALPDRISLMSQSSMRDYNNIVKKTINRLLC